MAEDNTPSERELDILKILWDIGSGSVREVHERMAPTAELAFNTVQTLLRNMEEKGLVGHRAEGRTFIYFPCHSRDRVASRFLTKVFDGALDQFVLSILSTSKPGANELDELKRLIDLARRGKQKQAEEE